MDLKDLRTFVAVSEAGGFRRAAEYLGIEQSALSRRVRNLEDELGVSLFERHRGGVRLTRAGDRFKQDVRAVLASLDVAVAHAASAGVGQNGKLRIGVGPTLFGGPMRNLMEAWREQHAGVHLLIAESSPHESLANVVGRALDLAIVAGADWNGGCEVEVLWRDQVNIVVPKKLAGQFAVPVPIRDLASRDYIVSRCGFGPQVRDWILRHLSNLAVSPRVEFFDVSRGVLFSMVGLGFGLTFATGAEAEVEYPNVAFLPVEGESIPYSALWLAENDNPALRRFLSLARMQLRNGAAAPSRMPDQSP
ncbi:LysR family transcriptional regulator [Bosea eneae]|uniref:LysR family transcriptional regulator n=1 Tax=Bosea eneae TaxID=151454 RepID=A0ABW0IZZ1_9HYPH